MVPWAKVLHSGFASVASVFEAFVDLALLVGLCLGSIRGSPLARCSVGIFREKVSLQPIEYYNKLPPKMEVDLVIALDPMIATCGLSDGRAFGEVMD